MGSQVRHKRHREVTQISNRAIIRPLLFKPVHLKSTVDLLKWSICVTAVCFSRRESWRSSFAALCVVSGQQAKGTFVCFVRFSCVNEALLGCYTKRLSSKGDLHFICSGMCPRGSHIHNETLRNPISTPLSVFLLPVLFSTICLSNAKRKEGGRPASGVKRRRVFIITHV